MDDAQTSIVQQSFSHSVIQSFSTSTVQQSFSHSVIQSFSTSIVQQSFSHAVIQSFSTSILMQSFMGNLIFCIRDMTMVVLDATMGKIAMQNRLEWLKNDEKAL